MTKQNCNFTYQLEITKITVLELLIQIIEEFSSLFPIVPRLRDAWVPHREKLLQLAEKSRTSNTDLLTLLFSTKNMKNLMQVCLL